MLIRVPRDVFADFRGELRRAVEATFPGFGYSAEEIGRFLSLNAEPYDDDHYVSEEGGRVVAVAMRCGDLVEYVVPSEWEGRYEAVARVVAAMKEEFPALRFHIKEELPSHAAWYAALLPGLGFRMIPRVRMIASVAALPFSSRSLSPMEPRWLEACVALHLEAYGLHDEGMAANLRDSTEAPDRFGSWTVALHAGEPIGSCFGSHHRGRLFVEELAVAEAHRRQGLGRELLLESVGKLALAFPEAETVVLDVDRTNVAAVSLYLALGFDPQERYTVARS